MVTKVHDASDKWFVDGIVIGASGSYGVTGAGVSTFGATTVGALVSAGIINTGGITATTTIAATTILSGASLTTGLITRDDTPQTLTDAGAVNITTSITWIVTTAGTPALTLIDGAEGQDKFLIMKADVGTATLTPSNLGNGSTIVFDDVGDSAHLFFTNGNWYFMGGTATLA